MSGLVNEGRAVDMVCLDFSKAFDTISHDVLLDKLMKYKIEWWTVRWIENWAMVGRALPAGWERCSALGRSHLECWVQFWSPLYSTDMVIPERFKWRAMMMIEVVEHLSYEELLWNMDCYSWRRLRGILAICVNAKWSRLKKVEPDSSSVMFSKREQAVDANWNTGHYISTSGKPGNS